VAKLTAKQERFVAEYLIDLNATQAAIRAGYSPVSARQIADENMAKPDIRSAIDKTLAERSRRTGVTADRVINELAKIAFFNSEDIFDLKEATLLECLSREDTAAVASIKVKRTPTDDGEIVEREVKTYDKVKALTLLGKHVGLFNDKLELSGKVAGGETLAETIIAAYENRKGGDGD
jgi:phage terminase small subunit